MDQNNLPPFPPPQSNYYYLTTTQEQHHLLPFPTSFSSLPNLNHINHDERRVLDAWTTKVARNKRRLARQRTLSLNRASSLPSSTTTTTNHDYSKGFLTLSTSDSQNNNNNKTRNRFTFCTPDKKILRMLLKKELKNSDVGSLGRIVLPKREAEENLPVLSDKEGIHVVIRDVNSHKNWAMKYKYWANNRSRMYVLENTGDFVKQNGLVIGDSMSLYEDECKNLYVSIKKVEKSVFDHLNREENEINGDSTSTYSNIDVKDEEGSIALLIEELKHKVEDRQEKKYCNNNPIVLGNNFDSCDNSFERGCYISRRPSMSTSSERVSSSFYNMCGKGKEVEDYHSINNGFEDCFGGLDTLPEVSGFKYPLFEYLSNDET